MLTLRCPQRRDVGGQPSAAHSACAGIAGDSCDAAPCLYTRSTLARLKWRNSAFTSTRREVARSRRRRPQDRPPGKREESTKRRGTRPAAARVVPRRRRETGHFLAPPKANRGFRQISKRRGRRSWL